MEDLVMSPPTGLLFTTMGILIYISLIIVVAGYYSKFVKGGK